jgi:nickel-type superoxide dismutase maturation protease
MVPTLLPGDRLLVVRRRSLEVGDVVALRDPRSTGRTIVKRVAAVGADHVVVHGDDPSASTDSRDFGPVPRRLVLGRVVYRYAPAVRAGRVRK